MGWHRLLWKAVSTGPGPYGGSRDIPCCRAFDAYPHSIINIMVSYSLYIAKEPGIGLNGRLLLLPLLLQDVKTFCQSCTYMSVYICIRMYIYMCIYIHTTVQHTAHTYVYVYIHTYIYIYHTYYMYTCFYIYIICIHTYIYMYRYLHICTIMCKERERRID